MQTLFTCSLNWEERRKQGPSGIPSHAYTNSLYTPVDNTILHSISSVCHPWGKPLLSTAHQGHALAYDTRLSSPRNFGHKTAENHGHV